MKKRLLSLVVLALTLAACGQPHFDWIDFVQFGGIQYIAVDYGGGAVGRALVDADLGPEFAQVQFKQAEPHVFGHKCCQDGDAAFLDAGTPVYRVKGYKPEFRLAARREGRLVLYEADTNPKAKTGADLLDIGGKVRSIGVNSAQDGVTELAAIADSKQVTAVVELVLGAPVDQNRQDQGGTQYFIAFHLEDGTVVTRAYWPDSGELSRGIILPQEFRAAVEQAFAATAPLTTMPVLKPVTIGQLPPIPRDLLFLDQGNLVRWNHITSRFETLSGNVTCYSVSADRRTVVLESARGGDFYEIAMLDLARGSRTSLVETTSPLIDLAISPDGQWVTYIQSDASSDEWRCRSDLVNMAMYPFSGGGPYSGAIYSLRVDALHRNGSETPVEMGHCSGGELPGLCGRVLWSPESRRILWSDVEGVWSFELGASQAQLMIPQMLNQPNPFDNRVYVPWRWSPSGRYVLTAMVIYEGVKQVALDTQTGQMADVPGTGLLGDPESKPAWMADGRLFVIHPANNYSSPNPSPNDPLPAIEIWSIDPQQPGMLVLENSFPLDVPWRHVPTGDPAQVEDGRLAFAILSRESGDDQARGLYVADPANLVPRKVNGLPLSLSESFYSQTGIIWSPDGQGAIIQDWGEHPMLFYVPTDGSAVYDLSPVIQGCCFTWLR